MKRTLILGGPGAGKTHALIDVARREIRDGTDPDRIAFVSFTKKAVTEARDRAKKDLSLVDNDLPYFRTIHSTCFQALGLSRNRVLGRPHIWAIGRLLGIRISGNLESEAGDIALAGDRMLFLENLARSTGRSLRETWEATVDPVPWYELLQFKETLDKYKEAHSLVDFADMLSIFSGKDDPLDVDVAIVDEAQDLTAAQWKVVFVAFRNAKRIYFAGDDDQAIYEWSGADVAQFLSIGVDDLQVLPESRRVPRSVAKIANEIASRIGKRYDKKWKERDADGRVERVASPSQVDLTTGSWYLLARNRCFLSPLEEECEYQGVPYSTRDGSSVSVEDIRTIRSYEGLRKGEHVGGADADKVAKALGRPIKSVDDAKMYRIEDFTQERAPRIWHEAFDGMSARKRAYYVAILRRGERITTRPRIHVDTIHGVKGGEADNVLLTVDQTARTEEGCIRNPDAEARVFYVGATRARENLFLMSAQSDRYYGI